MNLKELFFERYLIPFLAIISANIIISIISKTTTGNWIELFNSIPITFWIIFFILILLWLIIIYHRKSKTPYKFISGGIHHNEWEIIATLPYAGVCWNVIQPKKHPLELLDRWERNNPTYIEVSDIPICPKCGTELEETKKFLKGYKWECVYCGFKKTNNDNFYNEAERAKKIARTQIID